MTDHKDAKSCTHAEQDESVFIKGMIRVIDQKSILIDKNGLSFLKGYAVLSPIGGIFARIPLEAEPLHIYFVNTSSFIVKGICSPWIFISNRSSTL